MITKPTGQSKQNDNNFQSKKNTLSCHYIRQRLDLSLSLSLSLTQHGTYVRLKHKIATETVQGAAKELSGMKDLPLYRMPKTNNATHTKPTKVRG